MKLTYSWLAEHILLKKKSVDLANDLTSLGLEVEKLESSNLYLKNFFICDILKSYKHPNADRLKICEITNGKETFKVVCGAENAVQGLRSVFAPNGTYIPGKNFKIEKKSIRGIEGDGMLCSEEEIGLPEKKDGIIELNKDYELGQTLDKYIKEDFLFHIGLTPNRGDCASVRGIARDLSAKLKIDLNKKIINQEKGKFESAISWILNNEKDCPIIYGRHFKISENKDSPYWLKNKLLSIGLKPISSLVDITNYILFDIGRPLHVFDIKKLDGELKVSQVKHSEKFIGLDKKEYLLEEGDLVIRDSKKIVSLAGIMGGLNSCVDKNTKEVFLEVAYFDAKKIAQTGRRLGIFSDARYRFERGIDPEGLLEGLELATKLINDICGGSFSNYTFTGKAIEKKTPINLNYNSFERLVGYKISIDMQIDYLLRLNFSFNNKSQDNIDVVPPSWRHDINIENDIIEEILRIDGYEQIPMKELSLNKVDNKNIFSKEKNLEFDIKEKLAKLGLNEAVTFTFISDKKVIPTEGLLEKLRLANPISRDLNIMRNSLFPNLLDISSKNFSRGIDASEIFEIGYVFQGTSFKNQKTKLAILISGYEADKTWHFKRRYFDFFDIKAYIINILKEIGMKNFDLKRSEKEWYHPGISAEIKVEDKVIASFGQLHPSLEKVFDIKQPTFLGEIDINTVTHLVSNKIVKEPLLIYPYLKLKKDFSFLMDIEKTAEDLINVVRKSDELVGNVVVFDRYTDPKNKKTISIGLEVEIIQKEKVLNSEEINFIMDKIIKNAEKKLDARLRDQ